MDYVSTIHNVVKLVSSYFNDKIVYSTPLGTLKNIELYKLQILMLIFIL